MVSALKYFLIVFATHGLFLIIPHGLKFVTLCGGFILIFGKTNTVM